ncbi:HEAT repeat domain-containing protein [candidate division KSB1 bacterium]|nr:HEAT repeat domain-containing protein [candidate division KSB1 bacterium]
MNRNLSNLNVITRLILSLLVFLSFYSQILADTKTDLNNLLGQIKTYEYGQSREKLSELSDLVRNLSNSKTDFAILEQGLIDFLKTDATLAAKQFICKELSVVGTETAVPVLSKMLLDDKTADMARYALERIPGAKVDETLLKALGKTKGKTKIGIINTIGERRDKGAVKSLAKLVLDKEVTIAAASAAALGKIACPMATKALADARMKVAGPLKNTVLDAYLMCADQMVKKGENASAAAIYQDVFSTEKELPIRSAALRGMIITAGEKTADVMLKVIKTEQPPLQMVVFDLVRQYPVAKDLNQLTGVFSELAPTGKIQLLSALTDRGDVSVHDAILKAVKDENLDVRIAALKALAKLGNENDVELLATVAATGEAGEKEIARESLALLNTPKTDLTILWKIPEAERAVKLELIQSVGERRIPAAEEVLLKMAQDPERSVRVAAYKSLELVAEPKYLQPMVDLLVKVENETERRSAERAIVATARKIAGDNQAKVVLDKISTVKEVTAKGSLLKVAGRIGDKNARPVLQKALLDKNEDIQVAAINALSEWPTPEPLDELLKVAQTSKNEVQKVLALRGYIQLAGLENDRPADETMKLYQTAMGLATEANEKRMVLSGISKVKSVGALEMAAKYLDDAELQQEAEIAAVKIAPLTREQAPDKTKEVLAKVIQVTKNNELKQNAQRMLERMK